MKRIIALAFAVTTLATCGISAAEAATTTAAPKIFTSAPLTAAKSTPRGPTSAQLAKELLNVKQFPSGWSSTTVQGTYAREAFCGIEGRRAQGVGEWLGEGRVRGRHDADLL